MEEEEENDFHQMGRYEFDPFGNLHYGPQSTARHGSFDVQAARFSTSTPLVSSSSWTEWPQTSFGSQSSHKLPSLQTLDSGLDLAAVKPDHSQIASLPIASLTTDVHAGPWHHGVGSQGPSGWQSNGDNRHVGPMSDPTPNCDSIEDAFSSICESEAIDSAFASFSTPANASGFHTAGGNDQQDTKNMMQRSISLNAATETRTNRIAKGTARRRSSLLRLPPCSICGKHLKNRSDAT